MKQNKWILSVICTCTAVTAFFVGFMTGKSVSSHKETLERTPIELNPDDANVVAPDTGEEVYHDE